MVVFTEQRSNFVDVHSLETKQNTAFYFSCQTIYLIKKPQLIVYKLHATIVGISTYARG